MEWYEVSITYHLLTETWADSEEDAFAKADDWRAYAQTPPDGKNLVVGDWQASAEEDD